ncbi:hypothetical protein ACFLS5_03030 [Candidatus Bipolaricaulota bacterium]
MLERCLMGLWRLKRIWRIERGALVWLMYNQRAKRAAKAASKHVQIEDALFMVLSPKRTITDAHGYEKFLAERSQSEALRDSDSNLLGAAFLLESRSADVLSKLSRYESALIRLVSRSLEHLESLRHRSEVEEMGSFCGFASDMIV